MIPRQGPRAPLKHAAFLARRHKRYYLFCVYLCWRVHALFCFCTLVYAFVEGNILLSIVNFTWHAFIDPDEPGNDYVNSTTIIEGLNFTLSEESASLSFETNV